jgi:hypothetical protein
MFYKYMWDAKGSPITVPLTIPLSVRENENNKGRCEYGDRQYQDSTVEHDRKRCVHGAPLALRYPAPPFLEKVVVLERPPDVPRLGSAVRVPLRPFPNTWPAHLLLNEQGSPGALLE